MTQRTSTRPTAREAADLLAKYRREHKLTIAQNGLQNWTCLRDRYERLIAETDNERRRTEYRQGVRRCNERIAEFTRKILELT